jgi:hypothetical protein
MFCMLSSIIESGLVLVESCGGGCLTTGTRFYLLNPSNSGTTAFGVSDRPTLVFSSCGFSSILKFVFDSSILPSGF